MYKFIILDTQGNIVKEFQETFEFDSIHMEAYETVWFIGNSIYRYSEGVVALIMEE